MSQLAIEDLDFCDNELMDCARTQGGTYIPKTWDWSAAFSFDFDSDGIASFAIGHVSAYALAIGPIINTFSSNSRRR